MPMAIVCKKIAQLDTQWLISRRIIEPVNCSRLVGAQTVPKLAVIHIIRGSKHSTTGCSVQYQNFQCRKYSRQAGFWAFINGKIWAQVNKESYHGGRPSVQYKLVGCNLSDGPPSGPHGNKDGSGVGNSIFFPFLYIISANSHGNSFI